MKNENKYSEMIDILGHLHQYVPTTEEAGIDITAAPSTQHDPDTVDQPTSEKLHSVLFGGDQL